MAQTMYNQEILKYLKFHKGDKIICDSIPIGDNYHEFDCKMEPKESGWGFANVDQSIGKFNVIRGVGTVSIGARDEIIELEFNNDQICFIKSQNERMPHGRSRSPIPVTMWLECPRKPQLIFRDFKLPVQILKTPREIFEGLPLES